MRSPRTESRKFRANLMAELSKAAARKPAQSQATRWMTPPSTRPLTTSCWNFSGAAASAATVIERPISSSC